MRGKREKEEPFLCSSQLDAAAATQQSGATRHNYKEMNQLASLVLCPPPPSVSWTWWRVCCHPRLFTWVNSGTCWTTEALWCCERRLCPPPTNNAGLLPPHSLLFTQTLIWCLGGGFFLAARGPGAVPFAPNCLFYVAAAAALTSPLTGCP